MAWVNSNDDVISHVVARLNLADNTANLTDKLTYQKQASAMAQMIHARYYDLSISTIDGGTAWRTKYLNQADTALTSAINAANETARTSYADQVAALSQCVIGACMGAAHTMYEEA